MKKDGLQSKLFRQMWLEHRENVRSAVCKIDMNPPGLHAGVFLRAPKLKEDADTYMNTAKNNIDLLVNLNGTMRTLGFIDTFTQQKQERLDLFPTKYTKLRTLEKENYKFGQRLLGAKTKLDSWQPRTRQAKKKFVHESFDLPIQTLEKYKGKLNLPQTESLQRKLFRPCVYFDLEISGIKRLGRLTAQLYTEAAPQVVLEFMKLFTQKAANRIILTRIFPSLWIGGELVLEPGSTAGKHIEYDMRSLDHAISAGIFSFAKTNLKGFGERLNFSISFKPLPVLNGKRVAFGQIISGLKILDFLQDFGTKNGKPIRQVFITDCGLID